MTAFATTYSSAFRYHAKSISARVMDNNVVPVAIILAIMQIADGLLTAIGVLRWGIHVEGNPLLRLIMSSVGEIPALVIAKAIALIVIVGLCSLANTVKWIPQALKFVVLVYACFAVGPWSYILFVS